ncbi:MAG: amino acid transporter [Waddliaceae bacterium]|nr:amino acid transporter [Waddliaceae bacterium]
MTTQATVGKSTILSAMLLVGGTCIGAGMLANPIATGIGGFFPSLISMFISWFLMTSTGLMLLEVCLWMKDESAHIITMSSRILGNTAKIVAWVLFCFIAYASLISYTAGGGKQVALALSSALDTEVSITLGCTVFAVSLTMMVYAGRVLLGGLNGFLFAAMVSAFLLLTVVGSREVEFDYLTHTRWSRTLFALPILVASFHFHSLVPSLVPLLQSHPKFLRLSIIGGSVLTFICYLVWQVLVLGTVPAEGPGSLMEAYQLGETPIEVMRASTQSEWIGVAARYFAFFALVTSFLGMSLGLFDFLADGLKWKKVGWRRIALIVLIALPSIYCAVNYERAFYVALETSGGFGDAVLNGLMPVMMVWVGRYRLGYNSNTMFFGGRFWLSVVFVGFLVTVCMEAIEQFM